MHSPAWIIAAFIALDFALLVSAGVYFIEPASGSTCTAGTQCTLEWLDDGNNPLLNEVGVVTVGLYTGEMQLVQSIQPLDVSSLHSVDFTPIAEAGPNSGSYYIAFTSNAKVNGTKYLAFSPFFNLKGMSGSFSSPLAAATSTIAIPTTLTHSSAGTVGITITIGSVDTSLPSLPTFSSSKPKTSSPSSLSSQFTTSSRPTSASDASISPSGTQGSLSTPAPSSNGAAALPTNLLSLPILAFLSLCVPVLSSIS
ncbi:hypothetical protein FB451DRAFT_1236910 [Mycena latifolia]|nr:hypothetical protein FB451DRAFT_1236910 [Mycena latifolia]